MKKQHCLEHFYPSAVLLYCFILFLEFLIKTCSSLLAGSFGNVGSLHHSKAFFCQQTLDILQMGARTFVVIVTDHTGGQVHNDLHAILLEAKQTLAQILQLHTEACTTAATAGKGHIACVFRITGKFALTAIEGMGAIIATAALLYLLTLNKNN